MAKKESAPHFEVFEDEAGEYRWRLKAANGEITAQSEGYVSAANAERGIEDARRTFEGALTTEYKH